MAHEIGQIEADLALEAIQRRRHEVLAQINVPRWYWPGMGVAWVALGALADHGPTWGTTVAAMGFGAAHATIARRVLSGRHASTRVSIRRDLIRNWVPAAIVLFLLAMTVLTVAVALLLNADGARHPAALAGVVVAVLVVALGPHLMRHVRVRAEQRLSP